VNSFQPSGSVYRNWAVVDFAIGCCHAGPMTSDDIGRLRVAAMAAYGWQAWIDVTHRAATQKVRVVASSKGGEKMKKKAARRHKPIVAALAEGQSVKAVLLERELVGKKAPSESTIRRVKKAKGL